MSAIKENPVLFGCLALLGFASLLACSGVVATWFLADEIVEKASEKMEELGEKAGQQAGLKKPFETVPALLQQGWSLSVHVQNEAEVEFTLVPHEARTIDCAVLQGVLFPYLSGSKETVIVKSENRHVAADGAVTTTPVECRWSGYPGADVVVPSGAGGADGAPSAPPEASGEDDPPASPALEDGE